MAPQFREPSHLDAAWNTIRRWLPVVMTTSTASLALAQGPGAPMPPMEPKPLVAPKPADAKPEKQYEVKFDGTDWGKITEWLEKESGLMFISKDKPTGSITLKPNKKYTLGELIDLLNELLEKDNYIILRKSQSFSFYPADQRIPLAQTPYVSREELSKRGKTEYVAMIIPLVTLQADEVRDQVKKTLSPFGEVQSFGTDQLLVRDKAVYVQQVLTVLDDIIKNKNDQLNHVCDYKRASYVAETLRTLLKDPTTDTSAAANPNMQFGGGWGGGWNPQQTDPRAARTDTRRFRTVNITVDDAMNTLQVTGPADKIIAAKDLVKDLDKGDKKRPAPGKAEWVTYNVATGTAEALAKQLMSNKYYMNSTVSAMSVGTSQIYVYAYTADHLEISQLLKIPPVTTPVETKTVVVAGSVDLEKLTANVKAAVPGVTADATLDGAPGIVLRGAPELVKAAEDYISATVPKATPTTGNEKLKSITLPNGNSAAMAEHLAEMLKKMGKNAVIVDPNKPEKRPEPAAPMTPGAGGPVQKIGQANAPAPLYANSGTSIRQVKAQIVDPMAPAKKPDIIFSVIGNKLVITGDDPKDVQLAYEMLNLFTNTSNKPEERSDIIRLKNISAEDAAKVLTEVFNGPAQGSQGGQGNRGGGGGIGALFNPAQLLGGLVGSGAGAPNDPKAGRVRLVAEKSSNSLIVVRASEMDMITIRYILRNTMDSDLPPEGGIAKTWTIPLKHARASEVVATLRNVFANETGGGRRNQQPTPFNPFVPQAPQAAANAALTIDYDIESNRVVCKCTEPLYQEVRALCDTLDVATKESNEITEVIQLQGVAPSTVQQIIETLQGKTPTTQAGTFNAQGRQGTGGAGFGNPFGGGGNPFGGGGFGGGNPFGGGGGGGGGNPFGGGRGLGGGGGGNPFGGGGGGRGGNTGGGGRGAGMGGRTQRMEDRTFFDGGGGGQRPFDDAGMDAPSVLFDPETDTFQYEAQNLRPVNYGPREVNPIVQSAYVEPQYATNTLILAQAPMGPGVPAQPPMPPNPMPTVQPGTPIPGVGTPLNVQTPSNDTAVLALDGSGLLVIRARNKEEIENIKRIIAALSTQKGFLKETEVAVEIVPIKRADANVVLSELQQLFSRLQLGAGTLTFPQIQQQQQRGGFGGFPFGGQAFNLQNQNQQTVGTLVLFPIPRLNSILVAVPKNSLDIVKKYINELDVGISTNLQPVRYPLTRAAASIVQRQILDLFNNRFPGDTSDKIRVTVDTANNALLVQAGPSDQEDIARLIKLLDTDTSDGPTNDVKVFRLKNALADELTNVIANTLTANIFNPQSATVSAGGTGAGGLNQAGGFNLGGAGGGLQNNQFATGGGGNLGGQGGQGLGGLNAQANRTSGLSTKTNALRFNSQLGTYESGLLEDVHITPDLRINAVVVTAPTKTMKLIEAIINELDGVAAAKSYVNIFQLKKADATAVQNLLIQLFSRQQTQGGGGQLGGQFGGLGGFGGTAGQQGNRPLLTLTGNPSDGAALIDLRLTADARTNSLIVAGSQNDLELVRAVIAKLEDTYNVQFMSDVVKIRNAAAADVSTAVLTFLQQQVTQVNTAQFSTNANPFNGLQRQVFIQPEPVTNQLLISATPQMLPEIRRLIAAIDAAPPQVFVEVMIAEVRLNNNEEFGMELGLQSSVLFARGGATAAVPGTPGYNFNTTAALPNVANVNPGQVGFQGLGNLGVGRNSTTGVNVGGLVLSAANDSFNLLIRALKAQGRVDVLSRPTLMLTDNQTGFFQVGQQFPRIGQTTQNVNGNLQSIEYVNVGVVLRVTPRISPDGTVLMRVEPQVSAPSATVVQLAPGIAAQPIDTQTVETTVLAASGETVVLGGLIRKSDIKLENKVPVLGDIPWVGAAFRYRTQQIERREIVFVMTPRIIRTQDDMRRTLAEEARKMSWNIKEASIVSGLDPDIFRGKIPAADCGPTYYNPEVMTGTPLLQPGLPMYMNPGYQPQPFAPSLGQQLGQPTIVPQSGTVPMQPAGGFAPAQVQQPQPVQPMTLPIQQPALHAPAQALTPPQQPTTVR